MVVEWACGGVGGATGGAGSPPPPPPLPAPHQRSPRYNEVAILQESTPSFLPLSQRGEINENLGSAMQATMAIPGYTLQTAILGPGSPTTC